MDQSPAIPTPQPLSAGTLPVPQLAKASQSAVSMDSPIADELAHIAKTVAEADLPQELRAKLEGMLRRLNRSAGSTGFLNQYEEIEGYIEWVTALPWSKRHDDLLDLRHAQDVLNKNHFGLIPIKQRILEFLSVLTLQSRAQDRESLSRSPVLCFVGLPGIGKTSIAHSIAESLGRPFIRIPMGGMGTSGQLRGQPRTVPSGEPGQVIKSLRRVAVKNPVILLDEIDRTAETARAEIMGVLLEMLDPEQNTGFVDYYIDYPFNLGEVLFLASANNTNGVANAVLDRLEVIQMPGYSDEEKIHIAKDYLFPRQIRFANIPPGAIVVDENVWPLITRPLGFDAGIRTMERTINGMVRKIALMMVAGQGNQYHITAQNVKQFLPTW
jgi:ATP-dependent Lon protease